MMLVPLAVAKTHLHITDPARDAEVTTKLEHASGAIYKRIDTRADPAWDETSAPDVVQAATLKLLTALWEKRGDDDDGAAERTWKDIDELLMQVRDPALA
jgi:hypothetical protein